MKKLAILAALLVVAITNINAQESTPTELASNHSINTNIIGVDYSFDHNIGGAANGGKFAKKQVNVDWKGAEIVDKVDL